MTPAKRTTAGKSAKDVLAQLEALGNEATRKHNAKAGAPKDQFGVKRGDLRKVAKALGTDHALALELWKTRNVDARFVAILIMKPKELSAAELDRLVRSVRFTEVLDWLSSYVIKDHPDREALRQQWMQADDVWAARAGWALTAGRVARDADGLDVAALLDRLQAEMGDADPVAQWTMNTCLASIGIHHPKLRKRAVAVGEKLGVLRDYPTSKGCTSPFAPTWIAEMVKRQG